MKVIKDKYNSPNFDNREDAIIDMLVIHSTHLSFAETMDRLCSSKAKVSCHYVIDLNGEVYRVVKDQHRAWHAGVSYWRGRDEINNYSIGIELVDTDEENVRITKFHPKQMDSLILLCTSIITKYDIPPYNVVAHSDIAPSRKDDPGEEFNWKLLVKNNIGIYPDADLQKSTKNTLIKYNDQGAEVVKLQQLFAEYGYKISVDGVFDEETQDTVIAFKRHFYPDQVNDIMDTTALGVLENIVKQLRAYTTNHFA